MIAQQIAPFTLSHDGKLYKVSFSHEDGTDKFITAENVETGELQTFSIKNYAFGSGNEHLVGSLEERAAFAFVGQAISLFSKMHGLDDDL